VTALLEATGLAIARRLRPTDLRVSPGELVCLVGPNGSGKTSLLHAIAGIGGASGEVRIGGDAVAGQPSTRRKRLLAYLPPGREVAWPVTARALVRLGLPAEADAAEADAAMDALELRAFAARRVDLLSTGERSRVLIARALAAKPRLLLLDEPAANLDPFWQLRLMDALRSAAAGGQAVIAAMHDLDLAGRYADRILLMDGGRLVMDGTPPEVLASNALKDAFGIEKAEGLWRPLRPADPRSSP
jgi:iron complex transport system ATP-binding protein